MNREARTILYLTAANVVVWWAGFATGRGHWSALLATFICPFLGWGVGSGITLKSDEPKDGAT